MMSMKKGKFKNYLDMCIARAKTTVPDLARAVGTSPQNIHRLVSWQRKLTPEWAARLVPHLPGIEPADLLFGPDRADRTRRTPINEGGALPGPGAPINSEDDDERLGTIDPDDLLPMIREIVATALDGVGYDSLGETSKALIIQEVLEAQLGRQVRFLPLRSGRREKRPSIRARPGARRASDETDLLP